ncbi:3-methyl-2-oxobutanoatehydroxymethyltransferase [Desulfofarcimen acetoxidans DSM 771]|uniref:3-methyl-2-oxobutanoate hydroxymethyltransferase n=1 Tax=Desulfofarcimen acetoxidans (strain ATCC 49208 / DSM 771 / KCTC 5769 / VKM B-1644 / 5575) TaxID=485916 RepID=C8W3T9_DESAS|nr:3-methyl-2-oxobutanoate hydroxymethyltransferase [Desulfofarcimen acetoxidans]ACV61193.1 3-methyl-2-oxobutanoatehydroxymethyltransferase [Desulfofarcimen acetoxidans DSM 771]
MTGSKVTTATFRNMKQEKRPVTMLTVYDYPMAKMLDAAGIDALLVGDSLGNVVLGYDSTIPVTMDDMVHHVKAVCRGVQKAMVVADMPFLSYHLSRETAVKNAGRFLQEAGAQAVKLEGGIEVCENVRAIVNAGIPVMGHLGLTPQSVHQMGGYKVQGKDETAAEKLLSDANALVQAGVFSIVLECVPVPLAKLVTESVPVTTIGIGAGPFCDGQVLVTHDMLDIYGNKAPKFVKRFASLYQIIMDALSAYKEEVQNGSFPSAEYGFSMSNDVLEKIKGQ